MPAPYLSPPRTLSEADSKRLLADYGLPVLDERTVATVDEAVAAAEAIGHPSVLKLCGDSIAHKTERNLVRLGLNTSSDVHQAAQDLLGLATPDDGPVELLVAPMVRSTREFIVGADRSDEFGPVVMIGVGGIFAEVLEDVAFRLLPIDAPGIDGMLDDLASQSMLGEFRGEPAVDRPQLVAVVEAVAAAMLDQDNIASIDINPVLITNGAAVAVDALVALA